MRKIIASLFTVYLFFSCNKHSDEETTSTESQFNKVFTLQLNSYVRAISQTLDGGYLVAGDTDDYGNGGDCLMMQPG